MFKGNLYFGHVDLCLVSRGSLFYFSRRCTLWRPGVPPPAGPANKETCPAGGAQPQGSGHGRVRVQGRRVTCLWAQPGAKAGGRAAQEASAQAWGLPRCWRAGLPPGPAPHLCPRSWDAGPEKPRVVFSTSLLRKGIFIGMKQLDFPHDDANVVHRPHGFGGRGHSWKPYLGGTTSGPIFLKCKMRLIVLFLPCSIP